MQTWRLWVFVAVSLAVLAIGPGILQGSSATAAETDMTEKLLVDDFSRTDGVSMLGTRWEGFTDRVMGGLSEMAVAFRDGDEGRFLNMRGQVRLENRGGFIQARLPLEEGGGTFDARQWRGITIRARGRSGAYYIHLRTSQNWMPWQYYRAPIAVSEDWQEQFISFDVFEGRSTWRGMDPGALKSLAIVAYGEAFEADIDVARIELVAP
jgi:hypothetical protein